MPNTGVAQQFPIDASKPMSNDDIANYDKIGPIDDILISPSGEVKAMVIGVGGLLGMGEKEIAVETSSVHFVPRSAGGIDTSGNSETFVLIVNDDKAELEAMPAYKKGVLQGGTAESSASNCQTLLPSMESYEGYTTAVLGDISTDDLDGAPVYGQNDEDIGNVQGFVLGDDGKNVKMVLLDIGGFLGLGEHEIALTPAEVQIMKNDTGGDLRVNVNATKEQLEAQPEYKD